MLRMYCVNMNNNESVVLQRLRLQVPNYITTATTEQTTTGSGTQSDLLMMGIKMPETCWDTIDYQ